jgi:hypothetical protein
LLVLDDDRIRLFDITTGEARLLAAEPLPHAEWLTTSRDFVLTLSAEDGGAGSAVESGLVTRFGWDLSRGDAVAVRGIERRGIELSADGSRLAYVSWPACEIVLADPTTLERIDGAGESIPSGVAVSPDGRHLIAGTADQGSGAILFFDVTEPPTTLDMTRLPDPDPCPGLDDAPYFGAFSPSGRLALITNESWGGRGLFVYDIVARKPVWSKQFDSDDGDNWFPYPAAFARDETVVLAAQPDEVHAYRAADGTELGTLTVDADTLRGFAVDDSRRRIWVGGEQPRPYPFPAQWTANG